MGGGVRGTETGNDTAALLGVGAQLYLSRHFTLRLDYRLIYFTDKLLQKFPASLAGTDLGTRTQLTGLTTLGFTFLL